MRSSTFLLLLFIFTLSISNTFAQNTFPEDGVVEGMLTDTQLTEEYTFDGGQGDNVSLTLSSRAFDAYLILADTEGNELSSNDDSGGSLDSEIANFVLPEDGVYTVIVSSADGEGTGDYTLNLVYSRIETITYGDVVEGEISENTPTITYGFDGTEGDVILISMTSNEFDTFLTLNDGYYDVYSDDDGGDGTNSLIIGYTLLQTGKYFINARGYSQFSVGTFSLQIHTVDVVSLEANTSIEVPVNSDITMFSFEAAAGDKIEVDVTGEGGLDTSLTLSDPNSYIIFTDDDGGEDLNPEIHNYMIEETGTYSLIIQPTNSNAVGSYTLTLAVTKPTLITCGQEYEISFQVKPVSQTFMFEVTDMEFELSFTGDETLVSNLSIRAYQDDGFLGLETVTDDDYEMTVSADVDGTSTIRLLINEFSNTASEFTMELSCQ